MRTRRLQMLLMSEKYRRQMITASGNRRSLVPYSTFLGNRLALKPRDILFSAGSGWASLNIEALRALKQRDGFRYVQLCHDIIPIQFPKTYREHDFEEFRNFYQGVFPVADLVIFGAQRIKSDVEAYCRTLGISLRATSVTSFGSDAVRQHTASARPLRPGIERERYALLVSTIEPRKGHEMLYRIWKRLLLVFGRHEKPSCRLAGHHTGNSRTFLLNFLISRQMLRSFWWIAESSWWGWRHLPWTTIQTTHMSCF